jgi:rhamnulokinase
MPRTSVAAVDLGATSGRVIVGTFDNACLQLNEAHRFSHTFRSVAGHQYWDIGSLFADVVKGLSIARELHPDLCSCGVDTWGVDHVLTDASGRMVFPCHAYRDERTNPLMDAVKAKGDDRMLYDLTGIPLVNYNTTFQLQELLQRYPALPQVAERVHLLPHYLNFLLCGTAAAEYSMASSGQLLDVLGIDYCQSALDYFGIPRRMLVPLQPAGSIIGTVRGLGPIDGLNVALVPGHDTSCAFEAIPQLGNTLVISSGTWMLVGALSDGPCTGELAFELGVSNERTGSGGYRPNKTLLGMWLLERIIPAFDRRPQSDAEWTALITAAEELPAPQVMIDTRDRALFNPPDMRAAIDAQLRAMGAQPPTSLPGYLRLICASLGASVARTSSIFARILNRAFDNIVIVGGGSKNRLLCQMIADQCGIPVTSFNLEASSVGNIAYQLLALRKIKDLAAFHQVLKPTLQPKLYQPH